MKAYKKRKKIIAVHLYSVGRNNCSELKILLYWILVIMAAISSTMYK
jgi:hypothetical protein